MVGKMKQEVKKLLTAATIMPTTIGLRMKE
jgi:hypothetical protein